MWKTVLLILFPSTMIMSQPPHIYSRQLLLMGSDFEITVVETSSNRADRYIDTAIEEIKRIERIISSWDVKSETSKINRSAGICPVEVSDELFGLIERSIVISRLTDGAFDITYASMDKLWKFDGSMVVIPSKKQIQNSIKSIGYKNIILNKEDKTVFLKLKGMKIGFGGIGKGFAADKAKRLLVSKGVIAGIINASGDISSWGKQPDGTDWQVAITNPLNKNQAFALVPISNRAVVTSGDYEKFVLLNGIRYSHIINPKTGYPAKGIISVTVFAPIAEMADALATAVFVMGSEAGINRINQIPETDCVVIDDKGNILTSKNININGQ